MRTMLLTGWLFLAAPARAQCPYVLGQNTVWVDGVGSLAALGDFNGDGRADLMTLTYDPAAGAVLLAQADGTFVKSADLSVGGQPYSALVVDLDGGGTLDLVVVNQSCIGGTICGPGSISVFVGYGDGTFAAPTVYPTGASPLRAVAAKLDGDDTLDLAVADEVSTIDTGAPGLVSVLIGEGGGAFAPAVDYPAGIGVRGLAAGDLDGDGSIDLAMSNIPSFGNSVISLLRGSGDGTFLDPIDLDTCQTPVAVASADFDHDSHADLAVACGASLLSVFTAGGSGFGSFSREDYDAVFGAAELSATDVDGDGEVDLAVLAEPTTFAGVVSVRRGTGDGSFQDAVDTTLGSSGAIGFTDYDGDGRTDLVIGARWGTATIARGASDGRFGDRTDLLASGVPFALAGGDLDGNAAADLALIASSCSSCPCADSKLYGVLGDAGRDLALGEGAAAAAFPPEVVLGDFDGDGSIDAAAFDACDAAIRSNRGRGDGTFEAAILAADSSPGKLAVGDFNGDDKDDLVLADSNVGTVQVLLSDGDGTFTPGTPADAGPGAAAMAVADFDGNGDLDVAVADSGTPVGLAGTGLVSILLGDGAGGLSKKGDVPINSLQPLALAAGDLDGVGGVDLAVLAQLGSDFGGVISLLGSGDGSFAMLDVPFQLTAKEPSALAAADFNADGRLDVVAGMLQSAAVRLLEAQSDGSLRPSSGFGPAGGGGSIATADLDLDGMADLATANLFTSAVSVFWNGCPASPAPDGGVDAGDDGGAADGGPSAAGDDGCACHLGGRGSSREAFGACLLVAALALRPRRSTAGRARRPLS